MAFEILKARSGRVRSSVLLGSSPSHGVPWSWSGGCSNLPLLGKGDSWTFAIEFSPFISEFALTPFPARPPRGGSSRISHDFLFPGHSVEQGTELSTDSLFVAKNSYYKTWWEHQWSIPLLDSQVFIWRSHISPRVLHTIMLVTQQVHPFCNEFSPSPG